jgi:phosphate transport system substrate-binding protein
MKRTLSNYSKLFTASALLLGIVVASSFIKQGYQRKAEKKVINITGTRFFYPLVEKWAAEFKKENPDVDIVIKYGLQNADISMTGTPVEKENSDKGKYVAVSQFAIVAIINEKNPAWAELQKRGLSKADFERIYFRGENQENNFAFGGSTSVPIRVYARGACASATFSKHFGKKINDLANLDTKIADDNVLLENVLNDSLGVAYNNLGFVYDLQTRKQKKGIRVVPVDLNGNGKIDSDEDFYDTLDQLIQKLETTHIDLPPVGKMVFIFKENKPEVKAFVNWIQAKGQQYNHSIGFLNARQQQPVAQVK